MKAILSIAGCCLFAGVMAQKVVIAENAEVALRDCQEKAAASPMELREQMLSSCRCIVQNTDFKKANELNNQGKNSELKKLYDAAVAACTKRQPKQTPTPPATHSAEN